ncbi:MAG: hypothetical protein HY812_22545 [Planctomycetes bacterium]|nr:hypothetical protein [Planctomycetota bacterium]
MVIVVIVAIVGVNAGCRCMRKRMPASPEVILLRQMNWHVEKAQPQREHHEQKGERPPLLLLTFRVGHGLLGQGTSLACAKRA